MPDLIMKKGAGEMLIEGFYAIRVEISRNLDAGKRTEIHMLLGKLGRQILEETGYRYTLIGLIDLYELFNNLENRREKRTV